MSKEVKKKDFYDGKISLEDRVIILFTSILCFPVGFVLYYYFKDKKEEYHANFAKTGALCGSCITIFFILLAIFLLLYANINF